MRVVLGSIVEGERKRRKTGLERGEEDLRSSRKFRAFRG